MFSFFVVMFDLKKGRKMRAENFKKRVGKKEFSSCLYKTAIYERINIHRYSELAQLFKDETSIIYVFTCDETKVICTYK